jgi:hypothetical protein
MAIGKDRAQFGCLEKVHNVGWMRMHGFSSPGWESVLKNTDVIAVKKDSVISGRDGNWIGLGSTSRTGDSGNGGKQTKCQERDPSH